MSSELRSFPKQCSFNLDFDHKGGGEGFRCNPKVLEHFLSNFFLEFWANKRWGLTKSKTSGTLFVHNYFGFWAKKGGVDKIQKEGLFWHNFWGDFEEIKKNKKNIRHILMTENILGIP